MIGGQDPCETLRSDSLDNSDLWCSVTCVQAAIGLLLTSSPYSGEHLVNYDSMEGKTEKAPEKGQLQNTVLLNSLNGVPSSTYFPYPLKYM